MSYYIWLETAHDLPSTESIYKSPPSDPHIAVTTGPHSVTTGSTLMMKARGYTPAVQRYNLHAYTDTKSHLSCCCCCCCWDFTKKQ